MNLLTRSLSLLIVPGLIGCSQTVILVPPADIPAEVEHVQSNQSDFTQTGTSPLENVDAGEVIDDLENLDGCWGTFTVFEVEVSEVPLEEVDNFEAYRFDLAGGTVEWQILQRGDVTDDRFQGELITMQNLMGTFEITGDDGLDLTFDSAATNNIQTGTVSTTALDPPQTVERLATVSGDSMKIRATETDDEKLTRRADLVFRRFECP